ncbi:Glucosamine-6-phosphate isomerase (Glucosamine-6-phosphate deaminase) (GNPDA) (GlcN6P deaminase), partial [Cryomyces antarcticus]
MKLLGAIALFLPFASAIWPIPSSYTSGDTVLWVDKKVKITYNGETQSVGYIQNSSNPNGTVTGAQIVATAIQRTLDTIFTQNFIPWKFHPRNSNF